MKKLETDSIQLAFDQRVILNNIYLSCHTGEIVGLLGRNGSGKSCLLKIIFGTLRADNQSVRINNQYFSKPYCQGGNIRFLPQDGFLPGYLKVTECINTIAGPDFPLQDWDELAGLENMPMAALSGGQRKLLELLLILYSKADFILLDEPFSFLAPVTIEKVTPVIQQQKRNKGIILTDHMYRTVLETADRLYLISSGVLKSVKDSRHLADLGYISE